jgi:hypothetical protein
VRGAGREIADGMAELRAAIQGDSGGNAEVAAGGEQITAAGNYDFVERL